jgi:hypothetical protein
MLEIFERSTDDNGALVKMGWEAAIRVIAKINKSALYTLIQNHRVLSLGDIVKKTYCLFLTGPRGSQQFMFSSEFLSVLLDSAVGKISPEDILLSYSTTKLKKKTDIRGKLKFWLAVYLPDDAS